MKWVRFACAVEVDGMQRVAAGCEFERFRKQRRDLELCKSGDPFVQQTNVAQLLVLV